MQVSSPVSTSTSQPHTINPTNAPLTIDPTALLGGSAPSASTSPALPSTISVGAAISGNVTNSTPPTSVAVKQEPDDEHAPPLSALQHDGNHVLHGANASALASHGDASKQGQPSAARRSSEKASSHRGDETDDIELIHSGAKSKDEPVSLVDELLRHDHKAILRPDLSAFADARDALTRLLPYHVWNIPHHDLLKALGLKEDPVLSEIRLRKRRRISHLNCRKRPESKDAFKDGPSHPADASAEAGPSTIQLDSSSDMQVDEANVKAENGSSADGPNQQRSPDASDDDAELNELGLPTPLPDVPQPIFATLDYAESIFARRDALATRFRRTLTALDTTHRRAPNTSLSLEHLERLAYNDDREDVLAQIEELKSLKAKLESLEESRQIDVAESSAKINLSFGITDEIEREREKERELERIKRQQERAAAKAAKLEKEREARHRLGIFTPPPEPPSAPAASSTPAANIATVQSTASTSAASPAPAAPAAPAAPPTTAPATAAQTPSSLPTPSPYLPVSTPGSTPGGYPFPPGSGLPYAANLPISQAGLNGLPLPSPQYDPSSYNSLPGTPFSSVPPFGAMPGAPPFGTIGMPMPPGGAPMEAPASVPCMPPTTSMPDTPSTPAATPSKPPSKAKTKAVAAAATAASAPGTPGTPGVTPGPTPHRGRGRPRKHPLPGTPGGPPIGSSMPRKKKEKPPKQPAAAASNPATPNTPGAAAMSPPAMSVAGTAGTQARPPSVSPVPPTMPGPTPGYSGEMFASTLPPTPTPIRPPTGSPPSGAAAPMTVRPPTMHPTLTSATSLNTPRASPLAKPSPSPAPPAVATKTAPAKANGASPKPVTPTLAPAPAAQASAAAPTAANNANPSIPNHPIPLLIPVASLPRLSALGIQPAPSPHIRPVIGPNGQPQGLQGLPIPIDPAQNVPAVLLGISESTAEASADGASSGGKQQILHVSVVLSKLSPSQLSGLAVLMQSLQAQVEAGKRK